MTPAERTAGRELWEKLLRQQKRVAERMAWLYEHQEDPGWAEREAMVTRSDRRLMELIEELAEWIGDGAEGLPLLLEPVWV